MASFKFFNLNKNGDIVLDPHYSIKNTKSLYKPNFFKTILTQGPKNGHFLRKLIIAFLRS